MPAKAALLQAGAQRTSSAAARWAAEGVAALRQSPASRPSNATTVPQVRMAAKASVVSAPTR